MSKPTLDIIVTHHDEPWEVGKKFFDMLAMQRDVDMSSFRVIVVQDGYDCALDFHDILFDMPYAVETNITPTIPLHTGPAAARNVGLDHAGADWVMFCDFDDTFTSVCSLKLIINVLRDKDTDIGWMESWREERREENFVNVLKENFDSTDAKVYRRAVLADNNIRFDERFTHRYQERFNDVALSYIPAHRVKHIDMPFASYMKTFREDGHNSRQDVYPAIMEEMLTEQIINFQEARSTTQAKAYASDLLFTGYFLLNNNPDVISDEIRKQFMDSIESAKDILSRVDTATLEISLRTAGIRVDRLIQHLYMSYKVELMPPINLIDVAVKWAQDIGVTLQCGNRTIQAGNAVRTQNKRGKRHGKQERVAVYCGTRNVYESMITSAKSLLYHTPLDKVYFLTEDDTFPYDLPDCITNINVSGQAYFSPDGMNYKNTWTYMCLMRAAFSKILHRHDKVLSLDIDIAVNDDISDLFDIDMSDYYIAGVHEPVREQSDYINFGLVLMNLAKLRNDHMDDRIIRTLNEKYYDCPEQGCFSDLCRDHILLLPTEYNYTPCGSITGDTDHPRVIHYAGIKYWKHYSDVRRYADMDWNDILHHGTPHIAVYIGTANQYHMMLSSAKSLLCTTPMDKIYFLIEEDSFPEPLPDIIQCINVSGQQYFTSDGPNWNSPFSYMPMLRAAYPDMFPQYDIILSIDNDTIVETDISALFDTDMTNYYYAAALEARPGRKVDQPYFNTGVMLMNLQKMRADGIDKQTVADLNKTHYINDSQDALCVSCRDHILLITSAYNACIFTAPTNNVYIRHFAGDRNKPLFDQFAQKYDKPWNEILGKE